MSRYLGYVRTNFKIGLMYRLNLNITLLNNIFMIFLYYFLWKAIYADSSTINGYTFSEIFIYFLVINMLRPLVYNDVTWKISGMIKSGALVTELMRPVNIITSLLANEIGLKSLLLCLSTPLILGVTVYLFSTDNTVELVTLMLFLLSIALSLLIMFYLNVFVGIISFHTINTWGVAVAYNTIVEFSAGAIIPLDFLPQQFMSFLDFLPMKYILYMPVKGILLNKDCCMSETLEIIRTQVMWVVILYIISHFFWNKAVNKFESAGG